MPLSPAQAYAEVKRFSSRGTEVMERYEVQISSIALSLRKIALSRPPEFGGNWRDSLTLVSAGNSRRKLSGDDQSVLVELMTRSIGDYLDSWFDSEALRFQRQQV